MEEHRHQETLKELRKNDRRLKELSFQVEEDRKQTITFTRFNRKITTKKLKIYKRQLDETEEIAALNLAKYRKAQTDFGKKKMFLIK